jgi:hypothetical protein
MRLIQSDTDFVCLAEVYAHHCSLLGLDPYGPLDFYRQQAPTNSVSCAVYAIFDSK